MEEKICFLILAHTDPKQLRRLVYALDDPRFDVFIHLDQKMDEKEFDFPSYALKHSGLHVIKERVKVYWGEYSVVEATLRLFREALKTGNYQRFVTLSGLDYPIASNDELYDRLTKDDTELFIAHPLDQAGKRKIEYKYYLHHRLFSVGLRVFREFLHIPVLRGEKLPVLSDGREMTVYFSPEWNGLTREAVRLVLDTVDGDPEIERFFRRTYAPDELMIPSIIMNSPIKERVLCGDYEASAHYNEKAALHFLDYGREIRVFSEEDYERIAASGKMFFRKAVTGISDSLLDLLDEKRNREKKIG